MVARVDGLLDSLARIEGVAQAVAEEAGAQHDDDEHDARVQITLGWAKKYLRVVVEHAGRG